MANIPTIKSRIQLKNDTEVNWNKAGPKDNSPGFIPLKGELIVYSADEAHPFSRFKVGDGKTNVVNLPFVDSGSINGIAFFESFSEFPSIGSEEVLYFNTSENATYGWDNSEGYYKKYDFIKKNISQIVGLNSGVMTHLDVADNSLVVLNGEAPTLTLSDTDIIIGYGSN